MKTKASAKKELSPKQREELLTALKARFEKNMNSHKGLERADSDIGCFERWTKVLMNAGNCIGRSA